MIKPREAGVAQELTDAAGAVARLAGAGRTDFGLGIEARCQALVSPPETAEPRYTEAIDRLGRTQLRCGPRTSCCPASVPRPTASGPGVS